MNWGETSGERERRADLTAAPRRGGVVGGVGLRWKNDGNPGNPLLVVRGKATRGDLSGSRRVRFPSRLDSKSSVAAVLCYQREITSTEPGFSFNVFLREPSTTTEVRSPSKVRKHAGLGDSRRGGHYSLLCEVRSAHTRAARNGAIRP